MAQKKGSSRYGPRAWNDFRMGDVIDVRDIVDDHWYESTIREIQAYRGLKIHYNGWDEGLNVWIEPNSVRLAKRGTHTCGLGSRNKSSTSTSNESQEGVAKVREDAPQDLLKQQELLLKQKNDLEADLGHHQSEFQLLKKQKEAAIAKKDYIYVSQITKQKRKAKQTMRDTQKKLADVDLKLSELCAEFDELPKPTDTNEDDAKEDDESSIAECHICFNRYNPDIPLRVPKLLPCAHTFCLECLGHLLVKGTIKCPNGCGRAEVGQNGAKGLKNNFALIELLPFVPQKDAKPAALCDHCEEVSPKFYCSDCRAQLCQACSVQIHAKGFFKRHEVVVGKKPDVREVQLCSEHPRQPLELYCMDDQIPVCIFCKDFGAHKGHNIDLLGAVSLQNKEIVNDLISKLNGRTEALYSHLQNIKDVVETVNTNKMEAEKQLKNHFSTITDILIQARSEAQDKIESGRISKIHELQARQEETAIQISKLAAIQEECKLILGSEDSLFSLGFKDICEKAKSHIKTSEQTSAEIEIDPSFHLSIDTSVMDLIRTHVELGAIPPRVGDLSHVVKGNKVEIRWEASRKAENYSVKIFEDEKSEVPIKVTTTSESSTIVAMDTIGDYYFQVTAINSYGDGPPSRRNLFNIQIISLAQLFSDGMSVHHPLAKLNGRKVTLMKPDDRSCLSYIARTSKGLNEGVHFWEVSMDKASGKYQQIGIMTDQVDCSLAAQNLTMSSKGGYGYLARSGKIVSNFSRTKYGDPFRIGDVIGVLLDFDKKTLTFYHNGKSQGVAATGISGTFYPAVDACCSAVFTMNFDAKLPK